MTTSTVYIDNAKTTANHEVTLHQNLSYPVTASVQLYACNGNEYAAYPSRTLTAGQTWSIPSDGPNGRLVVFTLAREHQAGSLKANAALISRQGCTGNVALHQKNVGQPVAKAQSGTTSMAPSASGVHVTATHDTGIGYAIAAWVILILALVAIVAGGRKVYKKLSHRGDGPVRAPKYVGSHR